MCVVVRVAGAAEQDVAWDAREVAVVVRAGMPTEEALAGVRAVLSDLGSVARGPGLWCFCGEPVSWPVPLGRSGLCAVAAPATP